jgi:hypothetical protein
MASQVYPSDLSDDEWPLLSPLIPTRQTRRTATLGGDPADSQWPLLRAAQWLCMALSACRVWSVAHGVLGGCVRRFAAWTQATRR